MNVPIFPHFYAFEVIVLAVTEYLRYLNMLDYNMKIIITILHIFMATVYISAIIEFPLLAVLRP